jgi:thiol-disulfide isomerase/thioredoxin
MSQSPAEPAKEQGKARGGHGPWLIGLAVIALAAVLYAIVSHGFKPAAHDLKGLARGAMAKLEVPALPRPEPDAVFLGPDGQTLRLKDFKGQVLIVNLWATWCAPCVKEMPTLAQLQKDYAEKPVKVIAVSLDRPEDKAAAEKFIQTHGPLSFYHDPKDALPFSLQPRPEGVPTTVIYDRQGHERARLSGAADWDSPDAKQVVNSVLALPG